MTKPGVADPEVSREVGRVGTDDPYPPHVSEVDRSIDREVPLLFEELFLPLVQASREEARRRAGGAYGSLAASAHATFERGLLLRATGICCRALYARFAAYRSTHRGLSAGLFASPEPADSRILYRGFIRGMKGGGLASFYREYPVAARLVARSAELWVEATAEFLHRLEQDREALDAMFGGGESLGTVTEVVPAAGDMHGGGRSVIIARFASGHRLVYKPRPIGLEQLYAELLDRLRSEAPELPDLRVPRNLARERHGWIEFIETSGCDDLEEARSFYRRTGMILALVHALNGHDFHSENLVVAGAYPILIDLEALLKHGLDSSPRADMGYQGEGEVRTRFRESVAQTGMLPMPQRGAGDRVLDHGGLASAQVDGPPIRVPYWRHANSDHMRLDYASVQLPAPSSAPQVDGVPQFATDNVEAIVDGFQQTYRRLAAGKNDLFDDAFMRRFGEQQVRFILRPSNLYGQLMERGIHPTHLRSESARTALLEVLERPLRKLQRKQAEEALFAAEKHALQQLDIPLFSARADSTDVDLPDGGVFEEFFDRSALAEVRRRLAMLGDEDLDFQTALIRMALDGRKASVLHPPCLPPASAGRGGETRLPVRPPGIERFREIAVEEAQRVAGALEERVVRAADEPASWLGLAYGPALGCHVAGPLPSTLFSGSVGIALFLGALEAVTGAGRYRDIALSALTPVRETARLAAGNGDALDAAFAFHWSRQIGIAEGVAGAVYGLAHLADLLDAPELIDDAQALASLLGADRAPANQVADTLNGAAGIVSTLLALYKQRADAALLEQAEAWGRHLLAATTEPVGSGLAFGDAGIGLSFLRLYAATGTGDWLDAGHTVLDRASARLATDSVRPLSWIDGYPGLALARMELPDPATRRRGLAGILARIQAQPWTDGDSLCTGVMGRTELLAAAGLGEPARQMAAAVVERAGSKGNYRTGWGIGYVHVGLFQGITGVAYQMLRLAHPDRVPSVLTFA
jgi:type 2 lantibiotic biosynthesis protein LanM